METVFIMREQMENLIRGMEPLKKNQMWILKWRNTITEKSFQWLGLTAVWRQQKKGLGQWLGYRSMETIHFEEHRKKYWKINGLLMTYGTKARPIRKDFNSLSLGFLFHIITCHVCRHHLALFMSLWGSKDSGNWCKCWTLATVIVVTNEVLFLWLRSLVCSASIHKFVAG